MKSIRGILSACALVAAATACGTGVRAPQRYYVLDPAPASQSALSTPVPPAAAAGATTLLVTPTTATGFYDGQTIVYSLAVGTARRNTSR